jgi:hypothetical protein
LGEIINSFQTLKAIYRLASERGKEKWKIESDRNRERLQFVSLPHLCGTMRHRAEGKFDMIEKKRTNDVKMNLNLNESSRNCRFEGGLRGNLKGKSLGNLTETS